MIIKSLHIDNFGCLNNFDYNFNQFTYCLWKNGEGKTTLQDFICAMLYGMDNLKSNNFTLREKYLPFNNGRYGGELTFIKDGHQYRIVRYFKDKSKNDQFYFYVDDEEKEVKDHDVGTYIFDIDRESFVKTTLITSESLNIEVTSSLESILRKDITDVDDGDFQEAISILEAKQKEYLMRGNKGLINELEIKKQNLINQKNNLLIIQNSLNNVYYPKLSDLKEELMQRENQAKKINEIRLEIRDYNQAMLMKKEIEELDIELKSLSDNFIKLPTEEDVDTIINIKAKIADNQKLLKENRFENEKEYQNIKEKLEKFNLLEIEENLKRTSELENTLNELNNQSKMNYNYKKSYFNVFLFILGTIFLICGVLINIFVNWYIASIFYFLTLILICVFIYQTWQKKKSKHFGNEKNINDLENKLNETKEYLNKFFLGTDYLNQYIKLKEEKSRLSVLENLKKNITQKNNEYQAKIDEGNHLLKGMIDLYGDMILSADLENNYQRIKIYSYQLSIKKKQFNDFINLHDIDINNAPKAINEENINNGIFTLNQEIAKVSKEIESMENELYSLNDILNQIDRIEENIIKYRHDYDLLKITKETLIKADSNLKERYLRPLNDLISKYYLPFENIIGKLHVDKNFSIKYEKDRVFHKYEHLSLGQKTIVNLCFKCALIETVYQEKPFIIFDDPFMSLDKDNLEMIKRLLHHLKDNYQIIYMTCHESREV